MADRACGPDPQIEDGRAQQTDLRGARGGRDGIPGPPESSIDLPAPLGDTVRVLRGSTAQAELARSIGVSRSLLSRIESGQRRVTPMIARRLDAELRSGRLFQRAVAAAPGGPARDSADTPCSSGRCGAGPGSH